MAIMLNTLSNGSPNVETHPKDIRRCYSLSKYMMCMWGIKISEVLFFVSEDRKYRGLIFPVLQTGCIVCAPQRDSSHFCHFCLWTASGRCSPCVLSKQLLFVENFFSWQRFQCQQIFSPLKDQEYLRIHLYQGEHFQTSLIYDQMFC